jgi:hypothetical protein
VGRNRVVLAVVILGTALVVWKYHSPSPVRSRALLAPRAVPAGSGQGYATSFAVAEDPISEGGKWLGGHAVGLDWSDVATLPGLAFGTESGTETGDRSYDDSVALLSGSWGPDQTIEGTVYSINQNDRDLEEVELRLRSTLAAHASTGYEILFRCLKTSAGYASIVRWDGPLGRFRYLVQKHGPQFGVTDGDVVKATIVKNVITAYVNGTPLMRATDSTYSSGSPGIGFWLRRRRGWRAWLPGGAANKTDFGFTSAVSWADSPVQLQVKK